MNRRDILKVGLAAIVPTAQGMPAVAVEPPVDTGVNQPLGILTPIALTPRRLFCEHPPLTQELLDDIVLTIAPRSL